MSENLGYIDDFIMIETILNHIHPKVSGTNNFKKFYTLQIN